MINCAVKGASPVLGQLQITESWRAGGKQQLQNIADLWNGFGGPKSGSVLIASRPDLFHSPIACGLLSLEAAEDFWVKGL